MFRVNYQNFTHYLYSNQQIQQNVFELMNNKKCSSKKMIN